MTPLCPTCGNDIPLTELRVDLNTNIATGNGRSVKLTRQQAEILHMLIAAAPRAVSGAALITGLYGRINEPPLGAKSGVKSQISKLRASLSELGATINTTHGVGYIIAARRPKLHGAA